MQQGLLALLIRGVWLRDTDTEFWTVSSGRVHGSGTAEKTLRDKRGGAHRQISKQCLKEQLENKPSVIYSDHCNGAGHTPSSCVLFVLLYSEIPFRIKGKGVRVVEELWLSPKSAFPLRATHSHIPNPETNPQSAKWLQKSRNQALVQTSSCVFMCSEKTLGRSSPNCFTGSKKDPWSFVYTSHVDLIHEWDFYILPQYQGLKMGFNNLGHAVLVDSRC